MKLNLDFYKDEVELSRNDNLIFEKIQKIENTNYDESLKDMSFNEYNELSNFRLNVINWYEFKNKENVLEIGCSYGIITEYLSDIFKNVVNVDYSKKRSENISSKLENKENVEFIVGNLKDIKFKNKFDYIVVCSNQAEYVKFFNDSIKEYISFLKTLLNKNGTIIITLDNKFGVKYLCGGKDISENVIGNSFLSDSNKKNPFYSRNKLIEIFKEAGFEKYKFYYPLPDFNDASVIYSDEYLPKKNDAKLIYALNYLDGSLVVYNENNFMRQLSNNGYFKDFTNSFIVELSNDDNFNSDIYISFNNLRKNKFRTITKIKKDKVIKLSRDKNLNEHIKNIGKNIEVLSDLGFELLDKFVEKSGNFYIESKFCKYDLLSPYIIGLIKEEEYEKAYILIDKWVKVIKEKLSINKDFEDIDKDNIFKLLNVNLDDDLKSKLSFTKNGFVDLIFENIFYNNIEDKMYFFDQEWSFYNVPLEYIIYRSINNLFLYENLEKYISLEDVLKRYNIFEYKETFDNLEKKLQEYIIDQDVLNSMKNNTSVIKSLPQIADEIIKSKNECENLDLLLRNEFKKNKELNEALKSKTEELEAIYNSRSWKIISGLKNTVKGNKDEKNK